MSGKIDSRVLLPSKWRSPKDTKINVWKELSSKQINYIHIYGEKQGNYFFNSLNFKIYITNLDSYMMYCTVI